MNSQAITSHKPSSAFVGASWAALLLGIAAFLVGLWNAVMQLNEKGKLDRRTFDKGMGVIIKESARLTSIVEELLDFSRIQSGRMVLNKEKLDILAEFGGFEIAMMAGALLAGGERRITLLIDGFIATSALLVAARIAPAILEYCIFCHQSAEPGHQAQLRAQIGRAHV